MQPATEHVCWDKKDCLRAIPAPACDGLHFKLFFCHRAHQAAIVKLLCQTSHEDCDVIVSDFGVFDLQVAKNKQAITLGHMRKKLGWLGQPESRSSYLHFFDSCHSGTYRNCCFQSCPLQSMTTLDPSPQCRSTSYSPFTVSYHMLML